MIDPRKAEEIADQRVQMLSPLLEKGLDTAKAKQIRDKICEETGLSDRTIRRYLYRYRNSGFSGLKPQAKNMSNRKDPIPPHILEEAILLRREVPQRSVSQIIQILEWEGQVEKGQIKRSTLQEKLTDRGYSTRHMKMYSQSGIAARRYQQKYRNKLWHSDIKYAIYLPIGANGEKKQVYLVMFVDDCTRYVLHGEFYPVLDHVIVEDCFRKAIQKFGVPEAVFFDNGPQYRTKWMTRACSKMEIRLLYAKPYSPESTGKPERLNRVVDAFLREAVLEKPQTLDKLNELFWVWLDECHQNHPHSALKDNISPEVAYRSDKKPLHFLEPEVVADAFMHCEKRTVDKVGCISFQGKKYEVGLTFIGCKVDVLYDAADISELTIEYKDYAPFKVKELVIGERAGRRPKLPEHMNTIPANSSRLLGAATRKNQQRQKQQAMAISYRSMSKEDVENV
jgi:hypothetical protein